MRDHRPEMWPKAAEVVNNRTQSRHRTRRTTVTNSPRAQPFALWISAAQPYRFCAASFFMIATYRSVWLAIIFQLRIRLVKIVASAPLSATSMRR